MSMVRTTKFQRESSALSLAPPKGAPIQSPFALLAIHEAKISRISGGLCQYCATRGPVTGLIAGQMLVELARALRQAIDAEHVVRHQHPECVSGLEAVAEGHAALRCFVGEAEEVCSVARVDRLAVGRLGEKMQRVARAMSEAVATLARRDP